MTCVPPVEALLVYWLIPLEAIILELEHVVTKLFALLNTEGMPPGYHNGISIDITPPNLGIILVSRLPIL